MPTLGPLGLEEEDVPSVILKSLVALCSRLLPVQFAFQVLGDGRWWLLGTGGQDLEAAMLKKVSASVVFDVCGALLQIFPS